MAAWIWYGPGLWCATAAVSRSTPSRMYAAFHRPRSCSAIGTRSPCSSVRAGRRASVSSISASRPVTSSSSGRLPVHHPGQPDRLRGQVAALQVLPGGGRVALVEDQVEHVQDDAEPLAVGVAAGQREPGAAVPDGLLRPGDPAGHRRLGDQEGPGDLGGGQPADRPQREGDLRGRGERGVAAEEEQDQAVVLVGRRDVGGGRRLRARDRSSGRRLLAPPPGQLGPQQVGHPASGDGDQPGPRVLRYAVSGASPRPPAAAPPGWRPPRPRTGRSAGRACRGPAGPAGATGPRSGSSHGHRAQASSATYSSIGRTSATAVARTCSGAGQLANSAAISVARSKLSHSTTQ